MIAVFCHNQVHFEELNVSPKSQFKRILNIHDVRKHRNFTGMIRIGAFYNNKTVVEAYDEFQRRFPDLCKDE
jgi:hypothetical protein